MSHVASTAALSNHASIHKAAAAPEWQALTIKNKQGAQQTVRVAWLVQELRGLVAVVDVVSVVRGLAHVDAARFFSEQKENWQRSQSLGLERIAFTKLVGSGTCADSNRPVQDLEVCTLPDLSKVLDAMAAVQGQPEGAEDVSSRLQRSVQDWARIRLEQRVRELSDDQANIKAALQSVFHTTEPDTATSAPHASPAEPSASNALSALPAPGSNNPAPSTSSSRHSSPYIGPANGVAAPLSGNFWLYDPVVSTKVAPCSAGGAAAPGSNGSPCLVSQTMSQSSPIVGGHGMGVHQTNGASTPCVQGICAATSLVSALSSGTGPVGGPSNGVQMAQSRKRPRDSNCSALPAQALNFNRVTGGAEMFRCTLCGIEVANREDGSTIVSDVAVASCGHLYCTGCLTGAVVSGLPDDMYRCRRRRCGAVPAWYERIRHGFATQRVEIFKGQSPEHWLLPEKHRRFLAPEPHGGKLEHKRGVVLTVSTRGVPAMPEMVSVRATGASTAATSSGLWPPPSPSTSPALTRGPSPTLPPISTITGAGAPAAHAQQSSRWPLSPGTTAAAASTSPAAALGLPALVSGSGGAGTVGAGPGGGVAVGPHLPRHESCILYAGQVPDDAANRMLRKLCAYFWFSLY